MPLRHTAAADRKPGPPSNRVRIPDPRESDPAHNSRRRDPIGLRNTTRRGALDGRTPRAVHGGESGKRRPAPPAGAVLNVGGGIAEPGPPPNREITMAAGHHNPPLHTGDTAPGP